MGQVRLLTSHKQKKFLKKFYMNRLVYIAQQKINIQ